MPGSTEIDRQAISNRARHRIGLLLVQRDSTVGPRSRPADQAEGSTRSPLSRSSFGRRCRHLTLVDVACPGSSTSMLAKLTRVAEAATDKTADDPRRLEAVSSGFGR